MSADTPVSSRSLDDLHPDVARLAHGLIESCARVGIDLLVTCTYRNRAAQAALYAQGRTAPGPIVTAAGPGWSWHNWRRALDVVPIIAGKPVWDLSDPVNRALWQRLGAMGEACGLEWAGRWKRFREFPHFQYPGGLKLSDLNRAGA